MTLLRSDDQRTPPEGRPAVPPPLPTRRATPIRVPVDVSTSVRALEPTPTLRTRRITLEITAAPGRVARLAPGQLEHALATLLDALATFLPDGACMRVSCATEVPASPRAYHDGVIAAVPWVVVRLACPQASVPEGTLVTLFEGGPDAVLATPFGLVRQAGGHLLAEDGEARGPSLTVFLPPATDPPLR